jgi:MOSC domain-containing protein
MFLCSPGLSYSRLMIRQLGHICELVRYPVKSMAGVPTESAFLGWHGLDGDRRFAFRRLEDNGGFPWLTASRVPQLLLYHPFSLDESSGEPLPTHVRTPSGTQLELRSKEFEDEIAARLGSGVELMKLKHGIFDDACISVISRATMAGISSEAGAHLDTRRFRANIVLETQEPGPFAEDEWVGGRLLFGESEPKPAVSVTARDVRCMMINLDPDTAAQDARMLKTVVRLNTNNAGVYGTVVRTGAIHVGQPVSLVFDPGP